MRALMVKMLVLQNLRRDYELMLGEETVHWFLYLPNGMEKGRGTSSIFCVHRDPRREQSLGHLSQPFLTCQVQRTSPRAVVTTGHLARFRKIVGNPKYSRGV